MWRTNSDMADDMFESGLGPTERVFSACELRITLLTRGTIASLIIGLAILIGIIEKTSEKNASAPRAQLWSSPAGTLGSVVSIRFSPDGRKLASVNSNCKVILWDVATGQKGDSQPLHGERIWSIAFSPDGRILAGGTMNARIRLWDLASSEVRSELEIPTRGAATAVVTALTFSPDGRTLASATANRTLMLWAMIAGYPRITGIESPSGIGAVAFSPDGTLLASSQFNGQVRIHESTSPGDAFVLDRQEGPPPSLAFSPDGRTLATSTILDPVIRLWDLPSRRERARISGPTRGVSAIAFSPDGRVLAGGGGDGSLRIWDVDTCRERAVVEEGGGRIWTLAFAPDGRTLASGGNDGIVRLRDLDLLMNANGTDSK